MPCTPPIRHSSSPSSSSSSTSSYSYSTPPPSPYSSFSSSAVSVDANRTPERPLPIPSAPHHALHTLTLLCAEAVGARTLQDTHTEKSHVAAGAPITPLPRQPVKHQYQGITTITPSSINQEDRHFLGRKDKTSTELRQLVNWLLRSNCSQAGVGFDVKDQKTSSDDGRSSFLQHGGLGPQAQGEPRWLRRRTVAGSLHRGTSVLHFQQPGQGRSMERS
ncbi:hypothetical protein MRS44_016273 [Fusarium solani]|uniref:uncharacterized protein n=1 Tax=Fusarium solani TaxID=169388 RepID=UPI0032C4534F|nr:hypothetical protein MRS44_016273 [Fusarium solani]